MTDDLTTRKAAARAEAFARRKLAHAEAEPGADRYLRDVLAAHRGVPMAGYMPIRTEISPLAAMADAVAHGPVGVPVIEAAGAPLWFARWEPEADLTEGPFGARIPKDPRPMVPVILVVPLVAFSRTGGRLGYGGGFYDRTLEKLRTERRTLVFGFAYAAQEDPDLPLEATDQKLDLIITERGVITP